MRSLAAGRRAEICWKSSLGRESAGVPVSRTACRARRTIGTVSFVRLACNKVLDIHIYISHP